MSPRSAMLPAAFKETLLFSFTVSLPALMPPAVVLTATLLPDAKKSPLKTMGFCAPMVTLLPVAVNFPALKPPSVVIPSLLPEV